jgi:hypothetical protein
MVLRAHVNSCGILGGFKGSCERTKGVVVLLEVIEECFSYSHSTPLRSFNLGRAHPGLICR